MRVIDPWGFLPLAVGIGKLIFALFDKKFRVGTDTLLTLFAGVSLPAVALLADLIAQVTRPKPEVCAAAIRIDSER